MTLFKLILFAIWSTAWLASCTRKRIKTDEIEIFHTTGEAIAVNDLIQRYEEEHQKLYDGETKDGQILEWPALRTKNLSEFCMKYLKQSIPNRIIENVTGFKIRNKLHYINGKTSPTTEIVMVKCKLVKKKHQYVYYLTRALQSNCAFSLKCNKCQKNFIFTIINKYCDFEDCLKRKRDEIIYNVHRRTGQPIAKNEYLLSYEMEHKELFKIEGGNFIQWPYATLHPNLNSYCFQYMKECVPQRICKSISGQSHLQYLHYQKLDKTENVAVTTVTCQKGEAPKQQYHITRALENNCVYALLRHGLNMHSPLVIIFKHCDFEYANNEQTTSHNYEDFEKDTIYKTVVKEETSDTVEALKFFPIK